MRNAQRLLGPRSLLWKELRELAPLTLMLAASQVILLIFLAPKGVELRELSSLVFWWGQTFTFAAALYGALFLGIESLHGSRGFLLRMPVGRWRILAAKVAAAGLSLAALIFLARWLLSFLNLPGPIDPQEFFRPFQTELVVAWLLAAWLSLYVREPITAAIGSLTVLGSWTLACWQILPAQLVDAEIPRESLVKIGYLHQIVLVLMVVVVTALWLRGFSRLEDRPPADRRSFNSAPGSWWGVPLAVLDWRQKSLVLMALAALPILSAALSPAVGRPVTIFLWGPMAGAVLGALLFTTPERDGTNFFLHHLPVPRWRVVMARLVPALALCAVLGVELAVVLLLDAGTGGKTASVQAAIGSSTGHWLQLFPLFYAFGFGFGAILSPWMRSPLLGALLAWLSLAVVVGTPVLGLGPWANVPLGIHVVTLVAVLAIAGWSTVRSRALEPGSGKALRGVALLVPFWVPFLAWVLAGGS